MDTKRKQVVSSEDTYFYLKYSHGRKAMWIYHCPYDTRACAYSVRGGFDQIGKQHDSDEVTNEI